MPTTDPIMLVVETAWKAYEDGALSRDALIETLETAINARALTSGYADQHGLPFPERSK